MADIKIMEGFDIGPDVTVHRCYMDRMIENMKHGDKWKQTEESADRWHNCQTCGIHVHSNLYSAFFTCFVQENKLDISQALCAWLGTGILL